MRFQYKVCYSYFTDSTPNLGYQREGRRGSDLNFAGAAGGASKQKVIAGGVVTLFRLCIRLKEGTKSLSDHFLKARSVGLGRHMYCEVTTDTIIEALHSATELLSPT